MPINLSKRAHSFCRCLAINAAQTNLVFAVLHATYRIAFFSFFATLQASRVDPENWKAQVPLRALHRDHGGVRSKARPPTDIGSEELAAQSSRNHTTPTLLLVRQQTPSGGETLVSSRSLQPTSLVSLVQRDRLVR